MEMYHQAGNSSTTKMSMWDKHVSAAEAVQFARQIEPTIRQILATGVLSINGIASELNKRGIRTINGRQWYTGQVSGVLRRLGIDRYEQPQPSYRRVEEVMADMAMQVPREKENLREELKETPGHIATGVETYPIFDADAPVFNRRAKMPAKFWATLDALKPGQAFDYEFAGKNISGALAVREKYRKSGRKFTCPKIKDEPRTFRVRREV